MSEGPGAGIVRVKCTRNTRERRGGQSRSPRGGEEQTGGLWSLLHRDSLGLTRMILFVWLGRGSCLPFTMFIDV